MHGICIAHARHVHGRSWNVLRTSNFTCIAYAVCTCRLHVLLHMPLHMHGIYFACFAVGGLHLLLHVVCICRPVHVLCTRAFKISKRYMPDASASQTGPLAESVKGRISKSRKTFPLLPVGFQHSGFKKMDPSKKVPV